MSDRTCSIEDCARPHHCRGWCVNHYRRWRRNGDPAATKQSGERGERGERDIWTRVDKTGDGGCWLWTGKKKQTGYGRFVDSALRNHAAHRLIYTMVVGPIPEGLELDHLCRVRHCVNPAHLEPVTRRENVARSTNPARFSILHNTCAQGHELVESNVYRSPSSPGTRRCRICAREGQRRRWRSRQRTADGT